MRNQRNDEYVSQQYGRYIPGMVQPTERKTTGNSNTASKTTDTNLIVILNVLIDMAKKGSSILNGIQTVSTLP